MPSNAPQDWTQPRFGQLYKRVKRRQGDEDLPVLSVTVDGIVLQADHFNKKVASADTSNYLRVRRGEVAMSGLNLWKGGIDTQRIVPEGVVSPAYKVYSLRTDAADARFMAHYLRSPPLFGIYKEVSQQGASIVRRNVDFDALHASRLPLPPLPEQKKIAAILASVDEAIQATEAVIEQTRRVKEGLLQDLLTRGIGHTRFKQTEIGEIPESWEVVQLKRLIRSGRPICYGILKPGKTVEGGVPVVKVKNIKGGVILEEDLLLTDPEIDAAYQRSRLLPGDVLISIRGTTGRVAIVPPSLENANITQDTARLSIDEDVTNKLFVYYAIQSRRLQRYITHHTIGQAVKGINIAEVRKIPVAVPPMGEQDRIVEMISTVQSLIWQETDKLAPLQQVKAGLLQDLLSGAVRVSA